LGLVDGLGRSNKSLGVAAKQKLWKKRDTSPYPPISMEWKTSSRQKQKVEASTTSFFGSLVLEDLVTRPRKTKNNDSTTFFI